MTFKKDLIIGLSKKNKRIPSKYHYDLQGSKYFEKITKQKEYYPTRKEKEILKNISKEDRLNLRKFGVKIGRYHIFLPKMLKPSAVDLRVKLWKLYLLITIKKSLKYMLTH